MFLSFLFLRHFLPIPQKCPKKTGGLIIKDSVRFLEFMSSEYDPDFSQKEIWIAPDLRADINDFQRVSSEILRDIKMMAAGVINAALIAHGNENQVMVEEAFSNIEFVEEIIDIWIGMYNAKDQEKFLNERFGNDQDSVNAYLQLFNQIVTHIDYINWILKVEFFLVSYQDELLDPYIESNPQPNGDDFYYLKMLMTLVKKSVLEVKENYRNKNYLDIITRINSTFFTEEEIIENRYFVMP